MYDINSADFQLQMEHVTAKKPKSTIVSPSICGCVLSANRTFVQIFMRNWCGKDLNFQKQAGIFSEIMNSFLQVLPRYFIWQSFNDFCTNYRTLRWFCTIKFNFSFKLLFQDLHDKINSTFTYHALLELEFLWLGETQGPIMCK